MRVFEKYFSRPFTTLLNWVTAGLLGTLGFLRKIFKIFFTIPEVIGKSTKQAARPGTCYTAKLTKKLQASIIKGSP
ncbi:hypothetical protein [Massilia agri]|uniref:Uncharacterized protein n=1 Tax=Massilia agri TaxID=1886785 RepID=A0ABT2AT55_9BURK|nr:hypothetical protein [Massilia agri]MCS0599423.1 hypothetical protein [Massilia agri]